MIHAVGLLVFNRPRVFYTHLWMARVKLLQTSLSSLNHKYYSSKTDPAPFIIIHVCL